MLPSRTLSFTTLTKFCANVPYEMCVVVVRWVCAGIFECLITYDRNMQAVSALSNTCLLQLLPLALLSLIARMLWMSNVSVLLRFSFMTVVALDLLLSLGMPL